jgi:SOS response regulatory protein OraA/RecX
MSAEEVLDWFAYESLINDKDFSQKITDDVVKEQQKNQTLEEEAAKIRAMFSSLGK